MKGNEKPPDAVGAYGRVRTTDKPGMNRLLYQLSYVGISGSFSSCPGTQSADWTVLQVGFN